MPTTSSLIDTFGRRVDYLRISVTDRCDFRCVYCMAEDMTFMARNNILTLEEIIEVAKAFVATGVQTIRLTGGEPLIRPGIVQLCAEIKKLGGLRELCMTTNGARLDEYAVGLFNAGLDRLNISLDTLDPARFAALTRTGKLSKVLSGIRAAKSAGFRDIKLNCVMMKGRNDHEVNDLISFAIDSGLSISFIEEMPLGIINEHSRKEAFCSSTYLRELIGIRYTLIASSERTSGPSRYWRIADAPDTKIGFISPHSQNFCESCNRVRVTADGKLLLCLGNENSMDLRHLLRSGTRVNLRDHIYQALVKKPKQHNFSLDTVEIVRFMNATGG